MKTKSTGQGWLWASILLIFVVLVGGVLFLMRQPASTPTQNSTSTTQDQGDNSQDHGGKTPENAPNAQSRIGGQTAPKPDTPLEDK
jgi:hypothetical protein